MNKSAILITLVIVTAALLGIFIYDRVYNRPDITLWDLVPDNSGLVYEPQAGVDSWKALIEGDLGQTLNELKAFHQIDSFISRLDSIVGRESLNKALSESNFLMCLNPVSGSEIDFLLLLKLGSGRSSNIINEILKEVQGRHKLSKRNFNDFTIYELSEGKNTPFFSYSFSEYGWFGSFSAVLVEDVIRLITNEEAMNFKEANPAPFFTSRIKNDAGNLYFNYKPVSSLLNSFLNPNSRTKGQFISEIGENAFLDISVQDQLLLGNGFSFWSGNNQFLSRISNQKPVSSILEQYIPSRAAFCINISAGYAQDSASEISAFAATLENEFAVAVLEAENIESAEKLYYMKSADIDASMEELQELSRLSEKNIEDSVFYEDFGEYRITELAFENFIKTFSDFSYGTSEYYFFTAVNNYVVLSTNIESLKNFLIDIETENTWGKSVKKNNFFTNTLEESNFSVYIDINKSWPYLINAAHPNWQEHLNANAALYKKFEFLSWQFSNTDNKFFTNLILSHNPDFVDIFNRKKKLNPDISVILPGNAIIKPKVVRNYRSPQREVIIQSDSNLVSLIGAEGNILWNIQPGGKVISEIQQIDYYKNGYLQYLMAVDSSLILIDRNGNTVEGFPWKLPFKPEHFNVIDYDNSKKYRFIFSDIRGNIFMYDQKGNKLEGWRPFFSDGRLRVPPKHIRVRGRDCIILFQQSGKFFLLNRRAEVYPGFPINLGSSVNDEYSLSYGSNFENSFLTFINKQGLVTKVNLEGKIQGQQQILTDLRNPEYTLVPDVLGRGFTIVAREAGMIQFMNEDGNAIFTKSLTGSLQFLYQYYSFGSSQKLFVITDPVQEYSYLYNLSGELLNNSPIGSGFDIGVLYSESRNQYKIYSSYENKVNIYNF